MQFSWNKNQLYCFENVDVSYASVVLQNFCKVTDVKVRDHDYDDRPGVEVKGYHKFRLMLSISEALTNLVRFYRERGIVLKYEDGLYALGVSALNSKTNGLMLHSDRSRLDNIKYRRCYSSVLYVNDNYEGGEICFPSLGAKIKPKPGTLLTYPSDLRYAHYVKKVTSGTKFILQGYLTIV